MIHQASVNVVEGTALQEKVPAAAKAKQTPSSAASHPIHVVFEGKNALGQPDRFILTERLLSQHLLLIGGIGSGKTNTFYQLLQSIVPQLSAKDVMVIFDTKGDFYKEFYRPGDIVISNDAAACGSSGADYWNIVNELEDDGHLMENTIEIANALFADQIKNSGDSFFPNAAKDIVTAVLYHFAVSKNKWKADNGSLSDCFRKSDQKWYSALLNTYSRFSAMTSYIPADAPEQALGVLAELQQATRQVFVGNFAKPGTLSIRDLVRKKGGKKIFIEYDIGIGAMLTPIYSLLVDLAIKEALCRAKSEGNVFFVVDEFKLLPNLKHIDDAVNFGRSLGIKFMIGIQNTDQIIEAYNENMAKNIFSGFLNQFAFKVNDYSTRNYIKERAGQNRKSTTFKGMAVQETIETANVVEDWDISRLNVGEAIVMLNNAEPFKFGFQEYISRK